MEVLAQSESELDGKLMAMCLGGKMCPGPLLRNPAASCKGTWCCCGSTPSGGSDAYPASILIHSCRGFPSCCCQAACPSAAAGAPLRLHAKETSLRPLPHRLDSMGNEGGRPMHHGHADAMLRAFEGQGTMVSIKHSHSHQRSIGV